MPSDLMQRFEQLRRDPLGAGLPSPEALRRVGTHRRRARRAAAAGLAAAAVAVVAVAVNAVLPAPHGLPPPPGIGSPTPGPTPTRTTPTATATPEPTPMPSLIPDSAFPAGDELGLGDDIPGGTWRTFLPEVCGLVSSSVNDAPLELTETADLVASRWRSIYIDIPDPSGEHAPDGNMDVQIMVFAEGGASRFLESLRAAVAACPSDPAAWWGPRTFAAVADGPSYGDETFRFRSSAQWQVRPDSTETYTCLELFEVVRVGDAVHVADVSGWETCSADPEVDRRLRDRAIQAFVNWALTI